MKKDVIWKIIKDFINNSISEFIERGIKFDFLENIKKVYTIIWPRRAGKTFFVIKL